MVARRMEDELAGERSFFTQRCEMSQRLALAESLNLSLEASRRAREGETAAHELALRANMGW